MTHKSTPFRKNISTTVTTQTLLLCNSMLLPWLLHPLGHCRPQLSCSPGAADTQTKHADLKMGRLRAFPFGSLAQDPWSGSNRTAWEPRWESRTCVKRPARELLSTRQLRGARAQVVEPPGLDPAHSFPASPAVATRLPSPRPSDARPEPVPPARWHDQLMGAAGAGAP